MRLPRELLVGADGAKSKLREVLGIGFESQGYGQTGWYVKWSAASLAVTQHGNDLSMAAPWRCCRWKKRG